MSAQPEALRLVDELEDMTCLWSPSVNRARVDKAAAELRRLSAVEAQRDALLEALRDLVQLEVDGRTEYESSIPYWDAARAAIKAVEGGAPLSGAEGARLNPSFG